MVPGATVALSGGHAAKTDGLGQYELRNLKPGAYVVRVTAKGFAPFQRESYNVSAGEISTLNIALVLASATEQVTVTDQTKVDVEPANNASSLVLRGADLDALADDPDDLAADLSALAGPAAGPNGGDIFIDGFTGGRLPPKQSIREIRINQNPFAAQYDRPGQGRVEIFTKPGSDEFHGQFQYRFSDDALNSRNPFIASKPPYQRRQAEGELSGPINKKTSFFVDFERRDTTENAFINGFVLDAGLNIVPFSQAVVRP